MAHASSGLGTAQACLGGLEGTPGKSEVDPKPAGGRRGLILEPGWGILGSKIVFPDLLAIPGWAPQLPGGRHGHILEPGWLLLGSKNEFGMDFLAIPGDPKIEFRASGRTSSQVQGGPQTRHWVVLALAKVL